MMASKEFSAVVDDKTINLKIISITPEIRQESQKIYSQSMMEALHNNMMLRAEAEDILEERGLIDFDQQEKRADELRKELRDLEKKLRSAKRSDGTRMSKEEGKELAFKMRQLRHDIAGIGQYLSDFLNHTVENYASNAQMQYFIYACTVYSDSGKRYWASFEDFKNDTSSPVVELAISNFITASAGLDQDYTKSFYENQWLVRMGFMNNDLQLIDGAGRLVDEEGRLINDDGRFVNEDGQLVDQFGNLVDEKGNLIMGDGWGDTEPTQSVVIVE